MFLYPDKAKYERVLPKNKVYEKAKPPASVRERFVAEVNRIVWQYKLSPETVNLPSRAGVLEIQIFSVELKTRQLGLDVLRCIDQAIAHPIFFELEFENKVRVLSAYKRPHESIAGRWVVGDYFETPWEPHDVSRPVLPVALDMAGLYEEMLRSIMPLPPIKGETLKAQVERLAQIRVKQGEVKKLEVKLQREKQFNRKVEIHTRLRELNKELEKWKS